LSSLLDMTREEREEYVIGLYKEGKSVRQIAELAHMSFRDIGTITKKVKLQADRQRGYINDEIDTETKSPESQAFKMFSEGKSPIEVAILLDLAADRVRAIYREYWELTGRYKVAQIYDEARYNLSNLLKLHKIVNDLGVGEKEIIKVLELAKYNELENLQWKVEYLRNEVNMLENEKWKSTTHILKLNRMIDELEGSLAKKRQEMANTNQDAGWYDNTSNLYPTYTEPHTSSYSIRLSYSDYWP
jgi:DNA-binding CsgD family transcriptional regulator